MQLQNAAFLVVISDAKLTEYALIAYLAAIFVGIFLAWIRYRRLQGKMWPTKNEGHLHIVTKKLHSLSKTCSLFFIFIGFLFLLVVLYSLSLFIKRKEAKEGDLCHNCGKGRFKFEDEDHVYPILEIWFSKPKLRCTHCKSCDLVGNWA